MIPVVCSLKATAASLVSSLAQTLTALLRALKHRKSSELVALVREGSPLERFVDELLSVAFWILVLAPVILVPLYFLLVSLK